MAERLNFCVCEPYCVYRPTGDRGRWRVRGAPVRARRGLDAAGQHRGVHVKADKFDALIVRINPGQLSQGTPEGSQAMFDGPERHIADGKLVWYRRRRSRPRWVPRTTSNASSNASRCREDTYTGQTGGDAIAGFGSTLFVQPDGPKVSVPGGRGHLALLVVGQGRG